MQIKVLGPMTKQVELLFQNTAVAAKKLKCHAKFEHVSELRRIMARRQGCGRRQRTWR